MLAMAARAAAAPWIVPFVATALAQSRDRYSKSIGEARLMIATDPGCARRSPARAVTSLPPSGSVDA
jgi:hypothetical protein